MQKRYELNQNLAQILKGGVIMDVTKQSRPKIAEAAGAVTVMALESTCRHSPLRRSARMSDPKIIREIKQP